MQTFELKDSSQYLVIEDTGQALDMYGYNLTDRDRMIEILVHAMHKAGDSGKLLMQILRCLSEDAIVLPRSIKNESELSDYLNKSINDLMESKKVAVQLRKMIKGDGEN